MPIIGTQQSPIQIIHDHTFHAHFPHFYIKFDGYEANTYLNGTFQDKNFKFEKPVAVLTYDRSQWFLNRIHFHHKAEHLLDSNAPHHHEVHFIHYQSIDPKPTDPKVVISGFFEANGKPSEARDSFKNIN